MTATLIGQAGASLAAQAGGAVAKPVARYIEKLTESALAALGKKIGQLYEDWTATFGEHLQSTYERCSKIKTILHRDEPAKLLDLYVNIKLSCGNKEYDDVDMGEQLSRRKRLVITGTGGGGKTVFMRYFWISLFENPRGRIPIFLELRGYNEITSGTLRTYMFNTIVSSRAKVTMDAFERGIAAGLFIFMFDGLDEVVESKRQVVEDEILDLASRNPDNLVVVSSRLDNRFDSWPAFSIFQVCPLIKDQVVNLIEKLDYDKDVKKLFLSRLRNGLYESHSSFLSTPLLAIMMLMTFKEFAAIPEKIHIFYENAFDTLFSKHDFIKGGAYQRENKSKLSLNDFKELFSYFCLLSYYDTKFEFDAEEAKAYAGKAVDLTGLKCLPDNFISDLVKCVCMLQKDGLKFVFCHRSFQEFFAAYCLARFSREKMERIVPKIVGRPSDNVISMLFDMGAEQLEDVYLLPQLTELATKIVTIRGGRSYMRNYCEVLGIQLGFTVTDSDHARFHITTASKDRKLIVLLSRLYREHAASNFFDKSKSGVEDAEKELLGKVVPLMGKPKRKWKFPQRGMLTLLDDKAYWVPDGMPSERFAAHWMLTSGLVKYFQNERQWLLELLGYIRDGRKQREATIDALFRL